MPPKRVVPKNPVHPRVDYFADSDQSAFFQPEHWILELMAAFQIANAELMVHEKGLLVLLLLNGELAPYLVGLTELSDLSDYQLP
jgi:hypothetical protein